jgi:hypothetical protein
VSQSILIDQRHRLRAADLGGKPLSAVVRSIAFEGVEELIPLVYFEGMGRPLALDFDQRGDLARIAHSTVLSEWVGLTVVLRPTKIEGGETIRVFGIDEQAGKAAAVSPRVPSERKRPARSLFRLLLIVLIVAIALAAVAAVERIPNLFSAFGM